MIILYHKRFINDFIKLPIKIKTKFKERLMLLTQDEFNPVLNNHALSGKYEGYRSINITGDIRAIFKRRSHDIIFVAINSHSNLYS